MQIPIDTIYIEGNRSSHFKVLQDSARIYALLLKFIASSLIASGVDYICFFPDEHHFPRPAHLQCRSSPRRQLLRQLPDKPQHGFQAQTGRLFFNCPLLIRRLIMLASYVLIRVFNQGLGINLYVSKLITDSLLAFVGFFRPAGIGLSALIR